MEPFSEEELSRLNPEGQKRAVEMQKQISAREAHLQKMDLEDLLLHGYLLLSVTIRAKAEPSDPQPEIDQWMALLFATRFELMRRGKLMAALESNPEANATLNRMGRLVLRMAEVCGDAKKIMQVLREKN